MRRPAIGILLLDYEYSGVPGGLQDHTALEYETRVATVRGSPSTLRKRER